MKTSTTAALGRSTIYGVSAIVALGYLAWFIGPFLPGGGHDPAPLLSFLGFATGALGLGGGAATVGFGLRHQGAAAPPSAQLAGPSPAGPFHPGARDPADRPVGEPGLVD